MKQSASKIRTYLILTILVSLMLVTSSYAISSDSDEADLSLKNTGLANGDASDWPYGDEYVYEMMLTGPFSPYDSPRKMEMTSKYERMDDGGRLVEEYSMTVSALKISTRATLEFADTGLARSVRTIYGMTSSQPGVGAGILPSLDMLYEPVDGKMLIPGPDMEIDVPKAGFFFLTGVDTPGMMAFLFAHLDLDSGEPIEIWAYNGGDWMLDAPMIGLFRFSRIAIVPLDNSSSATEKWWRNTRKRYDHWMPGDDIRTFIMEIEDTSTDHIIAGDDTTGALDEMLDLYPDEGPYAAVYIDSENRVVRIEQPSGLLSDLAELKLVGGGGSWWGHEKQE